MPKVSNCSIKIAGEHKRFDIFYNKKDSFHVKDFPVEINRLVNKPNFRTTDYATERELINCLNTIVNEYHELVKDTRKVIVYKLYASSEIRRDWQDHANGGRSSSGFREGINDNVEDMSGPAYGIGFTYHVLLETKSNGVRYNHIKSNGEIGYSASIHRGDILIDWTQEREDALKALADGMHKLMVKICAALGDQYKGMAFLDKGVKLLS